MSSPFGVSGIGSEFDSLEPFLTCPPTDIPSDGLYSGSTQPIPHALTECLGSEFTAESLSYMALPDIEQAFHELCTASLSDCESTASISSARSDHQRSNSSTSGLATPADISFPPSSTAAPIPDWDQLSSSLPLDHMIRYLASYRLHTAGTGVQGGGLSATQGLKHGLDEELGAGGVTPWR